MNHGKPPVPYATLAEINHLHHSGIGSVMPINIRRTGRNLA